MERAHHGAGYAENAMQFMPSMIRLNDPVAIIRASFLTKVFRGGEERFVRQLARCAPRNERPTALVASPALMQFRKDPNFGALIARRALKRLLADIRRRLGFPHGLGRMNIVPSVS